MLPWELPHPFVGGGVDVDGPEPWCCQVCGMSDEHECHADVVEERA